MGIQATETVHLLLSQLRPSLTFIFIGRLIQGIGQETGAEQGHQRELLHLLFVGCGNSGQVKMSLALSWSQSQHLCESGCPSCRGPPALQKQTDPPLGWKSSPLCPKRPCLGFLCVIRTRFCPPIEPEPSRALDDSDDPSPPQRAVSLLVPNTKCSQGRPQLQGLSPPGQAPWASLSISPHLPRTLHFFCSRQCFPENTGDKEIGKKLTPCPLLLALTGWRGQAVRLPSAVPTARGAGVYESQSGTPTTV